MSRDPRDYLERTHEVLTRTDVHLAVVHLAAALLRQGSLSGAEVEAIVHDCGVTCERADFPIGFEEELDEDDESFSWSRF